MHRQASFPFAQKRFPDGNSCGGEQAPCAGCSGDCRIFRHPLNAFQSRELRGNLKEFCEFSAGFSGSAPMENATLELAAHMSAGRRGHDENTDSVMNGALADGDSFYDGEFYYDAPIGPK